MMISKYLLLLLAINCVHISCVRVEINVQNRGKKLEHFWRSTGLSPPISQSVEYLLSEDERINIGLMGAVPHRGIVQVRIHWLLNLISFKNDAYDFTHLDQLLDWLHFNKLNPGFELMGKPLNAPENIENLYEYWFNLTAAIARRYITRYGLKNVQKWNFETWNEPDLKMYNIYNFTLQNYTEYVSACADGLRSAVDHHEDSASISAVTSRSKLKLGGPAGLFKDRDRHPLCWGALELCNSISDTVCPLQYISFHKKGDGSSGRVLSKDLEMLDVIHSKYPRLARIPIANDEADILTTWSKDEEWRGDARYAAMVSKVIMAHYKELVIKRRIKIAVLSNDNGFLNYHPYYFTQRTLLARFQMNNTTPRHIQFVRKPVYSVMGLLSLLGERCIKEKIHPSDPLITVLATRVAGFEYAALIAYANDTVEDALFAKRIDVAFEGLPQSDCKYVIYVLENKRANPFLLWRMAGSPVNPSKGLLEQMRSSQAMMPPEVGILYKTCGSGDNKDIWWLFAPRAPMSSVNLEASLHPPRSHEEAFAVATSPLSTLRHAEPASYFIEPYRAEGPTGTSNKSSVTLKLTMSLPTVALVHICVRPKSLPGPVTRLQIANVTRNEALLIWKDNKVDSKCIKTYEVEFQPSCGDESGAFRRINEDDIIFLAYQHVATGRGACDATQGRYRVRAIDYWNRPGRYSKVIEYLE